jgi:hypothetical protein
MRVRFEDAVLDSETRQLFLRGEEVHLRPKAFQILGLLILNRHEAGRQESSGGRGEFAAFLRAALDCGLYGVEWLRRARTRIRRNVKKNGRSSGIIAKSLSR